MDKKRLGWALCGSYCSYEKLFAAMEKPAYLARHAPTAALLGKWPSGKTNFADLTKPYTAVFHGTNIVLSGSNMPRGQDSFILYTQEFGVSTRCNGCGAEVAVDARGRVQTKTVWGVGDTRIPPAGFVLSGHNKGAKPLWGMKIGDKVEIVDAKGVRFKNDEVDSGRKSISLPLGRSVQEIAFLWGTGRSMPLDGRTFGKVMLLYEDGTKAETDLAFGRDIACWETPMFFWGGRKDVRVWPAYPECSGRNTGKSLTGWSWSNPNPWKFVHECRVEILPPGYDAGLLVAGWVAVEYNVSH